MLSDFLKQETVSVKTLPLTFEANSSKQLLDVDTEGFRLRTKKGKEVSNIKWGELRELNNQIREKGYFVFWGVIKAPPMGEAKGKLRIKLSGDKADWEKLASVFDQLPPDVAGRQCPECFGPVLQGVCKHCGKSYRSQQRKNGMIRLLIGVAMVILGVILTNASSTGGKMTVYIGLLLIGAVLAIVGLIGVVFGVRT